MSQDDFDPPLFGEKFEEVQREFLQRIDFVTYMETGRFCFLDENEQVRYAEVDKADLFFYLHDEEKQ